MKKLSMTGVAALLQSYPHHGVEHFWDIEKILENPEALRAVVDELVAYYKHQAIDFVAGYDARGFLFASVLAYKLDAGVKQIRKKGKLPGPVISESYGTEYSKDVLEMEDTDVISGKRVLLIDDLLATGGTAEAGCKMVERLGGIVAGFTAIIELPFLNGRAKLAQYPVHSLISIVDSTPVVGVEYCVDMLAYEPGYPDKVVLIQRLNKPIGTAFPGGRIEPYESALSAVERETVEETGYKLVGKPEFLTTLSGLNRDPRGVKVSLLFKTELFGGAHQGERAKTRVSHISIDELMEIAPEAFVCDVHATLQTYVFPAVKAA